MQQNQENLSKNGSYTLTPNGGGDPIHLEIVDGNCMISFSSNWRLDKATGVGAGSTTGPRSG